MSHFRTQYVSGTYSVNTNLPLLTMHHRYDYDKLKKCEAPADVEAILKDRVRLGEAALEAQ